MHRTARGLIAAILSTFSAGVLAGCPIIGPEPPPPRTEPFPPFVPDSGTPPPFPDAGLPPPPPTFTTSGRPPIQGGTMALTADGVVVVDPQTGLVALVDLDEGITAQAMLDWHDHPGRVAVDARGLVHVVLRRAGTLVTFSSDLSAQETREVCDAPRGIAFDAAADALHVACATGELVTLPAAGGEPTRTVLLEPDLRDVVVTDDGRLHVTVFRSAELLTLDAEGAVIARRAPVAVTGEGRFGPTEMLPRVAWRARALPEGRVMVSHQMHVSTPLDVETGGYAGGMCGGAVSAMVSVFAPAGEVTGHSVSFTTLPVDAAYAVDADGVEPELAIVADAANDMMGASFVVGGARVVPISSPSVPDDDDCRDPGAFLEGAPSPLGANTSVEVAPDGRVIVQEVGTGRLVRVYTEQRVTLAVDHPAPPGLGRAHTFFHARTRSQLACASCHPEGGEDGHVWSFMGTGERRTQTLLGGIVDTAPFHWSGDQPTMERIMTSAMERMFGHLTPDDVPAMEAWLDVQPIDRGPAHDAEAIERGQATFVARCVSCHAGEALTNDESVHVGTGDLAIEERFQVPSLRGVAYHAPYLHDGCAADLDAVFDGTCGDAASHADLSDLSDTERADLLGYVRSL